MLAAATEHAVDSGLGRGEFGASMLGNPDFRCTCTTRRTDVVVAVTGGYFNNLRALNQTFVPMSERPH